MKTYFKMRNILLFFWCIISLNTLSSCNNVERRIFYIDTQNGDDSNNGLSSGQPFKSLEKAGKIELIAGDWLLLKAGQTFSGTLLLDSLLGNNDKPIVISTYGKGRAVINAHDSSALKISHSRFITVKNLECKGSGRLNGNTSNGFDFIDNTNLIVDSVEASGFLYSGIRIKGGRNIRVTNVFAHDNGFCGIHVTSDKTGNDESKDKSIRNVYIGYCVTDNNPGCPVITDNHSGNGILIGGVTSGTIEYCESMRNGWDMPRKGNGPVGIWAYQSDSITIQHCYAHHNATSPEGKDGGGFDFDGGVTNSVMQYNLSSFNEGPGYGIFQYADALEWCNNVVRYNISFHDGIKNGQCGILMWCDPAAIPMKDFYAYNNTVVNKYGYGVNFLPGNYDNFVFENNIFLVTEPTREFTGGVFTGASFDRNLYWNTYHDQNGIAQPTVRLDANAIVANPLLSIPEDDSFESLNPQTINTISFFKLNAGSPAINTGNKIAGSGRNDYWGNLIIETDNRNIGAHEEK